ncbi:MAG: phosphopyruvate hydratase [Candidatus Vogelbacteria bacterium CG10_big_fil_rev_8_21_14_0_10_45_14]|uniref:Enolase n=1 Tax=Candidatus Vogelbacteria bacterium CG10_big_fil_rev_8_21_14_0_10_45_14 TaxID=1975042 RepID=A0A2H0RKW1_9BACT|nr:MAG: phosphopyruvate hydratase [Candidatus Vogelbacteria bacterium CG10_big_fil_rev_8_21_14_0_10_45_14]
MYSIQNLKGREILDSRGTPTIEVDCLLDGGIVGRASVPSGASTGSHEAIELRDGEMRYFGMGVEKAIHNVDVEINEELSGKEWTQKSLDDALIHIDGTNEKSRLGANAMLAVSLAFAKSVAIADRKPFFQYISDISNIGRPPSLPTPMMNVINGGLHAPGGTDIQEYMLVTHGFKSFKEKLRAGAETYRSLKDILRERGERTLVGDEGGFSPSVSRNEDIFTLLVESMRRADYREGEQISIAIDVAASEFYEDGKYELRKDGVSLSSSELAVVYKDWTSRFPLMSIEDGLAEDDWDGWVDHAKLLGEKTLLVGDDLFVTNAGRIKEGIGRGVANAVLIKPNQIGTLTETIEAVQTAYSGNYKVIISHRSGETEDTAIAHLAVGLGTEYIKAGAPARGERTTKYNELLRIEQEFENK